MKLLFLNALKGLRKKKIQMFGIVAMVMLSTAVYTGMNTAIDSLEDRYYSYLEDQNVEDFSFGVNLDYQKDIKENDLDYLLDHQLKNITEEEKRIIDSYRYFLQNPTYDIQMIYSVKNILDKYDATSYLEQKKIKPLQKKYDFSYELERSKTIRQKNQLLKIIPYSKDNKINKPYLVEGKFPEKDNEITILPGYAKKNNLSIGDTYKIHDQKYKIVGFSYAPDYVYPLISFSMPIFDEKTNDLVFMTTTSYEKEKGVIDNSYALKYNYPTKRKFKITMTTETEKNHTVDPLLKIFEEEEDTIIMDMNTITRIGRIGALQLEFASNRLFAKYFLYLLLSISVLIIVVITKKRIDDERLQIGVLKALGYNRFSIATSYLVYPILGSIVGGILGFLIGNIVSNPIASILRSYYTVPLDHNYINWTYLKTSILTPMIVLSLLSYIIAIFMLRKKPLHLLKEGSNLKVNFFSKIVNKLTSFFPFTYRFKYSLAFRSFGKLLIVTLTSFCTGLLITLILIGSNLFNNAIEQSFNGIDYQYMVMLNSIDYQDEVEDDKNDYVLSTNIPLIKITDKNHKNKKIKKENKDDITVAITGIDSDVKTLKVLDKKDHNIISQLDDEDHIIINENAKEILGLEVGDILTFKEKELEFEYTVAGFYNDYMGYSAYTSRSGLSQKIGFNNSAYSMIYSNDKKYSSMDHLSEEESKKINTILSVEDLKNNIQKQMDRFNGSIYIVIGFASFMTLIIIAVIANIVVEENKKTISLMKVMGYKNKQISNIVLNIYTPFIIIAYLLSIPVMKKILNMIVKALVGDIEITIPIELSPTLALIGLIGLLIAYYIAVYLSKRVLNKIPLAIALKRE